MITYQIYDTTTSTFSNAVSLGSQSLVAGTNTFTGPVFGQVGTLYPYVQNVVSPDVTVLHPGTFGTVSRWSVLTLSNLSPGTYSVQGAFARANNALSAGDGVNVLVFANRGLGSALYSGSISSNNAVDVSNLFTGSGVAAFNLTTTIASGDVLRFVVAPGRQASTALLI